MNYLHDVGFFKKLKRSHRPLKFKKIKIIQQNKIIAMEKFQISQ